MTVLDGIVLARSGFNHSMNYRSAVVIGRPRRGRPTRPSGRTPSTCSSTTSTPGRSAALRRPTRKELAATTVLALPLHEASVKRRAGDPLDEDVDVEAGGVWAGRGAAAAGGGRAGDVGRRGDVPVPEHVRTAGRRPGLSARHAVA